MTQASFWWRSTTFSTAKTRSTSTSTRRASASIGRNGSTSICPNGGKILEVRGVSGTSVDRDRHDGIHETLDKTGKKWDVVEVYGKWDDPTAQKVTADAIAVQKHFDGFTAQGGDTGVVQAMHGRQAAVRAVRRRDRERLPQVLRQVSPIRA